MHVLAAAAPALVLASIILSGCGDGGDTQSATNTTSTSSTSITSTTNTTTATSTTTTRRKCLCIFDIDRTLTGKQGRTSSCPHDSLQSGVTDSAYGGGTLTLSAFTQAVAQSACAPCYLGTISAGDASGPGSRERAVLHEKLSAVPGKLPSAHWSSRKPVTSPLVVGCPDTTKQEVVPRILAWYRDNHGIEVADADVHFFDDRADNVRPFRGLPYNARQISCATRDFGGVVGMCGATLDEIVLEKGVKTCADATQVV